MTTAIINSNDPSNTITVTIATNGYRFKAAGDVAQAVLGTVCATGDGLGARYSSFSTDCTERGRDVLNEVYAIHDLQDAPVQIDIKRLADGDTPDPASMNAGDISDELEHLNWIIDQTTDHYYLAAAEERRADALDRKAVLVLELSRRTARTDTVVDVSDLGPLTGHALVRECCRIAGRLENSAQADNWSPALLKSHLTRRMKFSRSLQTRDQLVDEIRLHRSLSDRAVEGHVQGTSRVTVHCALYAALRVAIERCAYDEVPASGRD